MTNKKSIDDNNMNIINTDWIIIIDEKNNIINDENTSLYDNNKEPSSIELNRESILPVNNTNLYNFDDIDYVDDYYCNFLKKINFNKIFDCFLVSFSNIFNIIEKNLDNFDNNNYKNLEL